MDMRFPRFPAAGAAFTSCSSPWQQNFPIKDELLMMDRWTWSYRTPRHRRVSEFSNISAQCESPAATGHAGPSLNLAIDIYVYLSHTCR